MSDFFQRPNPQQAVPGDLSGVRQAVIRAILGGGAGRSAPPTSNNPSDIFKWIAQQGQGGSAGGGAGAGALGGLLGLTNAQTPGGDVLGPLSEQFHQNLAQALSMINNQGGRFSSGNAYLQGDAARRALNDYNVLAANVLEHGRDRQLTAIQSLLGPVLQPTFGGPFTQGASGFENLLGGVGAVSQIPGLFGRQK